MQDAFEPPGKVAAQEMGSPIPQFLLAYFHIIRRCAQNRHCELGRQLEYVVGINKKNIIAMRSCQIQGFVPVVGEINPGTFCQLPGDIGKIRPDDILRPVGRARIDDGPIVDD